jgi:hypothetical protein
MMKRLFLLTVLVTLGVQSTLAQTPGYEVLYSFKGGSDGSGPNGVTLAKNGVLYGTTYTGGRNTCGNGYLCGTVYELIPSTGGVWTKTVIHSFNGADGALPSVPLVIQSVPGPSLVLGANGVLYGTTDNGGSYDTNAQGVGGTVFELTPPTTVGQAWTETVLYSFQNKIQAPHAPNGGLVLDSEGSIYGTTFTSEDTRGANLGGTVFKLVPPTTGGNWTESTLIDFYPTTSLGYNPPAGLVYSSGSFFGTNYFTDQFGCGTVYELSPPATGNTWTATAIYTFGNGCNPAASLTIGQGGILYGTTITAGSGTACQYGCGTIFQLTPPTTTGGAWTESTIYNFTGANGDGGWPAARLVLGKNGVLYGTNVIGGIINSSCTQGCGTVFQLSPPTTPGGTWTETILHTFTGQTGDGSRPGPLTLVPNGALFGSTWSGGAAEFGTVFAIKP